ncbi:hypothetical protein PPERSA_09317 [Pseudocohnilembus persalinus]|uniref:Uncharacterized protein n=1 Tax=Pseudocohnilembus persalinus TaxID=266149 RepID=A0A0V0R590_PSEPJ|nr:hypothetical protein PPERSA_09317 [Pseudocohnilembus persalinus]|eukprot:KRX09647.1 hypothetical protein PPERSA_09317 [Pseudocohnilembus persalinus]
MNPNLVRSELYEDDYIFNEQEFKEFHLVQTDPYWKARTTCYLLSINCFGDKQDLIQRAQALLFNNYLHKKPQTSQLRESAELDLELIVSKLHCKTGKYDHIKEIEVPYEENEVIEEKIFNAKFPWDIVPELSKIKKNLSYPDIYRGIVPLMRSTMIFYNHFASEDALTGVVGFPYTIKMLDYLSPPQLYSLVKNLQMKASFDASLRNSAIDILKQKLVDLYYAVDDNPRLHGVHMCQSPTDDCCNLSSQYCANNMCKLCCQNLQSRDPCHIHDNFEQFSRYKLKKLYHFEEIKDFDKTKTLRLYCRKLVRKYTLEQIFQGLGIEWEKLKIYFHHQAHKIQYIYLTFKTQEEAARVYNDRHIYEMKMEKEDVQIQCMNDGFWKKQELFQEPENVLVIIKPLSTLEIVEEIPKRHEYTKTIHNLVQTITQLSYGQYEISPDINPVTDMPCQQHMYITLPSKEMVDKMYNAQPYLGCLVAHKLSHIQYLPFLRYHKNQCLQCNSKKEYNCIHDMCKSCCSRQKYGILECPCSYNLQKTTQDQREEMVAKNPAEEDLLCEKCTIYRDGECKNKLCQECCQAQAIKKSCPFHESSVYLRKLIEMKPHAFARKCLQIVGEINLKLRNDLLNGRYDWFRPIHNCHIQNGMIKANKELQEVKDNGAYVRTALNMKHKKEGKILTYQGNQMVQIWVNTENKTVETLDREGQSYIEYIYGEANCQRKDRKWEENSLNHYRIYTEQEYTKFINSPCLKAGLQNNFDLFIIGLDSTNFSARELLQDIYSRLTTVVGEVQPQHIMLLDSETVKAEIYKQPDYMTIPHLEENFNQLGRGIIVKFNNVLDALALMVGEININVPLYDGSTGKPNIYPSAQLQQNLMNVDISKAEFNYQNAGPTFQTMNKEIKQAQNALNNLVNQGTNKNNNKGKFNNNKNKNKGKPFNGPKPNKKVKQN